MKEFLNRDEYVYLDTSCRMSTKMMAKVMYAAIVCKAGLPHFFSLSDHKVKQADSYNLVHIKVHIHPSQVSKFEEMSGISLHKPPQMILNSRQPNYG